MTLGRATSEELIPREYWEPEPPLVVSQWADRDRMLTAETSAKPGRWETGFTPYLREIMDAFSDPEVEEITIQSATRNGKTEAILNMLGYVISCAPAPAMVVVPRDDDAKDFGFKRVRTMVMASPALLAHTTGKEDDLAGKLYVFDRMWLKFAGANSPADLASDAIKYLFLDELNKYPKFSGREADPVRLAIERTRSYWDRKIIKTSTPTTSTGYITAELERSDWRRYHVPCPRCGAYRPLIFTRDEAVEWYGDLARTWHEMRWPKEAPLQAIREDRLAWYDCGACHGRIEEVYKPAMLEAGVWCPKGGTVNDGGQVMITGRPSRHRGYQLPAFYSPHPTTGWSDIAVEFLESKDNRSQLMNVINSVFAEPYRVRVEATKADALKARIAPYPLGMVPEAVVVLVAAVDVQKDHVWFVVRGFGVGEASWLIRYGRVETIEEVEHILIETSYPRVGHSDPQAVRVACIDSGYRTNEIYQFCRKYPEILRPIKGYQHLIGAPQQTTRLDQDAAGRTLAGGLLLWRLDVAYYKDKLSRLIHTGPGDPGAWWLCEGVEQDYFDQMTAEHKVPVRDRRGGKTTEEWQLVSENRGNHLWDCEFMCVAAADMLKVFLLREPGHAEVYQPKPKTPGEAWLSSARGPERHARGWMARR